MHTNDFYSATSRNARIQLAYELSDWLRLTDHSLNQEETQRFVSAVARLHPGALKEFSINLGPHQGSLWDVISWQPTLLKRYETHIRLQQDLSKIV